MAAGTPTPGKLQLSLIGPRLSGKTALLATMRDSVRLGSYGYSTDWQVAIDPVVESNGAGLSAAEVKFKHLRDSFYDPQFQSTDQNQIFDYEFSLALGDRAAAKRFKFEVTDSAGELAVPRGDVGGVEINEETQKKVFERFFQADAVIFVVPLLRLGREEWVDVMSDLVGRLVGRDRISTKRLVVAFSQYERLFVRLGPSAWQFASDPLVAKHVVRETLKSTRTLNMQLMSLAQAHEVDVRFTVTSAYGFTRDFGNPNIDPFAPGETRFRLANQASNIRALNEFWRPFLTADPFIYAASGVDSAFTFSREAIEGRSPPIRPGPEPKPNRTKTIVSFFSDFFDVNRRSR